jgi:hypothetical protein
MRDQDLIIALIILAFSGLSTLASWLQKRRQEREQGSLDPNAPPAPRPLAREATPPSSEPKADWEEQLRRLLEGEGSFQPPETPPPVLQSPVRPAPPPLPEPVPSEAARSEPERYPRIHIELPDAAQAYKRAAQAPEIVALPTRRSREIAEPERRRSSGHPRRAVSPVAAAAIAQLRTRHSAQQALITATILGPPKAFASPDRESYG